MPVESDSDSQVEVASVGPHSAVDSGEGCPEVEKEIQVSSLVFGAAARAALVGLDSVDLEGEFLTRACVMKGLPAFLRGLYRASMRFVLSEADRARDAGDAAATSRAWKLFLLLPCLLLHRPPRGGNVPKCQLMERFSDFAGGRWFHLLEQSRAYATQASVTSRRRRRRPQGDEERRRADRAQALVQMGELSAGRSGNAATRRALTDPSRRPPVPREPLRDDLFQRRGQWFSLDHDIFAKNLRVARRGAAAGPSG